MVEFGKIDDKFLFYALIKFDFETEVTYLLVNLFSSKSSHRYIMQKLKYLDLTINKLITSMLYPLD